MGASQSGLEKLKNHHEPLLAKLAGSTAIAYGDPFW